MTNYIGNKPTDLPLVSSDLADNIIINSKMADDSVGIADLSATGSPSSSTFLRGDNAWAEAGGGKLLQLVNATNGSNASTSTQSYVSYLTAAITPSSSSNKIFIAFTGNGYGNTQTIQVGLFRGGVSDTLLNTSVTWNGNSSAYNYETKALSLTDVDSPSTTNAQTYTIGFRPVGGNVYAQLGEAGYSVVQNLTLMEIAG